MPRWLPGELAVVEQFSLLQRLGTNEETWTRSSLLAIVVCECSDWTHPIVGDDGERIADTYVVMASDGFYRVHGGRLRRDR